MNQLPVGVEHATPDARRARGLACGLEPLLSLLERRIRHPLHGRRCHILERGVLRLDTSPERLTVERDDERRRAHVRPQQQPVRAVVYELEIRVGVVHRGVPPERVVADVEGVIRARSDVETRLVGRVEHGRRDLAHAAPEPRPQLAVDDHGRLEEALRGRAVARRAVERERRSGADQRPVDEVRDELDVVDPVRLPAVEGLVRGDPARDLQRLRVGGRPLRGGRLDGDARHPNRRREGRCEERADRLADVHRVARLVRHDGDRAARGLAPARVDRRAVDGVAEAREVRVGAVAADPQRASAALREVEQLRDPPARQPPACRAERQVDGSGDCGAGLDDGWLEIGCGQAGRTDVHRQRDRGAREGRKRPDDRRGGRRTRQLPASLPRHDDGLQPAQLHRRLVLPLIDRAREPCQLVLQRPVVHARRRRDVGPEDPHLDATEAAQRPEATAFPRRSGDRAVPVDLDAELLRPQAPGVPRRGERDRDVLQRLRARFEQRLSLGRGQSAHVHACDTDTGRELRLRSGEGQADEEPDCDEDGAERQGPQAQPALLPPPPPSRDRAVAGVARHGPNSTAGRASPRAGIA